MQGASRASYPAIRNNSQKVRIMQNSIKLRKKELLCKELRGSSTMKPKSPKSVELYNLMLQRGYREEFCDLVTKNLNTDFTAQRMIGYLYHYEHPPVEEIADEMISILSDRNRIIEKKELEAVNARWNDFLMRGIEDEEE